MSTGRQLVATTVEHEHISDACFTLDGSEIWDVSRWSPPKGVFKITKDSESGITKLQPLGTTVCPPEIHSWWSTRGHQVTDDGWILSPTQKRLLWLPY